MALSSSIILTDMNRLGHSPPRERLGSNASSFRNAMYAQAHVTTQQQAPPRTHEAGDALASPRKDAPDKDRPVCSACTSPSLRSVRYGLLGADSIGCPSSTARCPPPPPPPRTDALSCSICYTSIRCTCNRYCSCRQPWALLCRVETSITMPRAKEFRKAA